MRNDQQALKYSSQQSRRTANAVTRSWRVVAHKIKEHGQWWNHCYHNERVCAYLIYNENVKINELKVTG